MNHALHDLARHNSWATTRLLEFCTGLDAQLLDATAPGTFGTIIETLRHTIDSEASYLFRLTGFWAERPWRAGEAVGLDVLAERARILADAWERFLAQPVDTERLGEARGDNDEIFAVPASVFITQALHHANEHRAHVCTIIGAHGIEAPELSGWEYAIITGRATLKTNAE